MTTLKSTIIKRLLAAWPTNTVALDKWLKQQGVSKSLKAHYIKSGWMKSIGHGAVVKPYEDVDWVGAVWALKTQEGLPIIIGGKNAISLQGMSHYVHLGKETLTLFLPSKTHLPLWFLQGEWSVKLQVIKTSFIKPHIGINKINISGISIEISSLERAILELIYLAPKKQTYEEIDLIFEHLDSLRPDLLQDLLNNCSNHRVVRLFLYLAERHQHPWFHRLNLKEIPMGSGVLQLEKGGVFIKKYKIVVPHNLTNEEENETNIF